jgi:hypothetical protein
MPRVSVEFCDGRGRRGPFREHAPDVQMTPRPSTSGEQATPKNPLRGTNSFFVSTCQRFLPLAISQRLSIPSAAERVHAAFGDSGGSAGARIKTEVVHITGRVVVGPDSRARPGITHRQ